MRICPLFSITLMVMSVVAAPDYSTIIHWFDVGAPKSSARMPSPEAQVAISWQHRVKQAFAHYEQMKTYAQEQLIATQTHSIADADGITESSMWRQVLQLLQEQAFVLDQIEETGHEFDQVNQQAVSSEHHVALFLPDKATYGYDDLLLVQQRIIALRQKSQELHRLEQNTKLLITRRMGQLDKEGQALKERSREQKEFSLQDDADDVVSRARMLDIQVKIQEEQKVLFELQLYDVQLRYDLVQAQLQQNKQLLNSYERRYDHVKRHLNISLDQVKKAELRQKEQLQQYSAVSAQLSDQLVNVQAGSREIRAQVDESRHRLNMSPADFAAIEDLTYQPKGISQWNAALTLIPLTCQVQWYAAQEKSVEAQKNLKNIESRREQLNLDIMNTWVMLTRRRGEAISRSAIEQALIGYRNAKGTLQLQVNNTTSERDLAISSLASLNKRLDRIAQLRGKLQEVRNLFSDTAAYQHMYQQAFRSEELVRQTIDIAAQLIEKYQATLTTCDEVIKQIDTMEQELSGKSFWQRSDQSIDLAYIRAFMPELKRFFVNLYVTSIEYFSIARLLQLLYDAWEYVANPYTLILGSIAFILLLVLYWGLWFYIPEISSALQQTGISYTIVSYVRKLAAVFMRFIAQHLLGIYVWLLVYIAITQGIIRDPFIGILVHLLSIPYFLYLVWNFMWDFMAHNDANESFFMHPSYSQRFFYVSWIVLSILVCLYFLRGALLLDDHAALSEAPTILLAIMFIVVQIGLISLLGKQQMLSVVPQNTPLWQWVYEHVQQYYYVVWSALIVIIVMSNPYVGFGRQVFYMVSRVLATIVALPLVLWIHTKLKGMASNLFFYYEEGDMVRERFSSGRLWYGLFTILSFMLFSIGLVYVVLFIWDRPLSLDNIIDFFTHDFASLKDESGNIVPVTLFSLIQIVLFVIGGLFLNYLINQFVVQRVFDPIIVGAGVQNTIASLTKYGIILASLFIGLTNAGLEALTTKFAILLAGLGFAAQEPLRDFVSYFIILVQRPVKIGDFIQVKPDVMGVVRHITPRSVILRQRNSVTLIVPNSHLIVNPVMNWSYVRSYFAFDDIMITVDYSSDPEIVRKTLLQVLEENPMVLKTPAPIVWLDNFVENGYQFLVRGFLTSDKVLERFDVASRIRLEIVRRLRELGVAVAAPSHIVTIKSDSAIKMQQ